MTIDVLSRSSFAPIIVGDGSEIGELQAVGQNSDGRFHLVMDGQQVPLSPEASTNFGTATHLLVVSLSPSAEITTARRVRLDDLDDGQELSSDQHRDLGAALSLNSTERAEALALFWKAHPGLSQ